MKSKYKILLLLFLIVFISGCTSIPTPPPDKPYIQTINVQNEFVRLNSNEKATVGLVISNPLQITFSGKVELQFQKPNCLTSSSENRFTVDSKNLMPITIDIMPQGTNEKCVGFHLVTAILKDVNGVILDAKTGEVYIVQR